MNLRTFNRRQRPAKGLETVNGTGFQPVAGASSPRSPGPRAGSPGARQAAGPIFQTSAAGFSLLEVLVAVGLMSIVILALYSMFDQTQKALRHNAGQTDVAESGRSAMELIVRDVEKAWASRIPGVTNLVIRRTYPVGSMPEVGDAYSRDSAFHELFLLSRPDVGIAPGLGLFVARDTNALELPVDGVGTMYRYEVPGGSEVLDTNGIPLGTETIANFSPQTLLRPGIARRTLNSFWPVFDTRSGNRGAEVRTNASRLMDGVVFFRVFAYAPNGRVLDYIYNGDTNGIPEDAWLPSETARLTDNFTAFYNATVPATLEVELGTLPPRLLTQYRSLPNANLKTNFLARNFANILVFRQRIALRTALQ